MVRNGQKWTQINRNEQEWTSIGQKNRSSKQRWKIFYLSQKFSPDYTHLSSRGVVKGVDRDGISAH
jgi:hypothetical protein